MRRFFAGTWFATAVFIGVLVAWGATARFDPFGNLGPLVAGLVVVPPIWWWFVARGGRPRPAAGAAAGAVCTFIIAAVPLIFQTVLWEHDPNPKYGRDGFGIGLGRMMVALLVTLAVAVGAPAGALVGAATAALQSRLWPSAHAPDIDNEPAETAERIGHGWVRATWLPTAIFAAPILVITLIGAAAGLQWLLVIATLLVSPPIWWWLVARSGVVTVGKGARAGAVVGALMGLAGAGLVGAAASGTPGVPHDLIAVLFTIGGVWLLVIPPAVILGAAAAILQRRQAMALRSSRPPSSPRRGSSS